MERLKAPESPSKEKRTRSTPLSKIKSKINIESTENQDQSLMSLKNPTSLN